MPRDAISTSTHPPFGLVPIAAHDRADILCETKEVAMYKTIIWATDGSEGASVALREALTLAS